MSPDIGEFLRSRRARIRPEDVGFPAGGRRRVPGLRREELAQLAGVSVDYYVRLEQGRSPSVSDAVLDAIAGVLGLNETERDHLRNLVRPAKDKPRVARVRPGLQRLMDMMDAVPAFVLGRRMDVLAWNALANALMGFEDMAPGERNAARHAFLHPGARTFYPEWEKIAAETVAFLRLDGGRHPDDARLAALVGELSLKSETFRGLWAQHSVKEKTYGTKLVNHPVVGELVLDYETFSLPGEPDQLLAAYTAPAGSASLERLQLLASWQAPVRVSGVSSPEPR